jgi:hypothetical protein
MNTNCDFIDTNTLYNGKKIYECKYCGVKLVLDDPSTQMLCFKKMIDVKKSLYEEHNISYPKITDTTPDKIEQVIMDQIRTRNDPDQNPELCNDEQIQDRLKICSSCEFYKNNLCELCGCTIVRENNYMNKLAHKSASCPDNRWGPIT